MLLEIQKHLDDMHRALDTSIFPLKKTSKWAAEQEESKYSNMY